MRNFRELIAWQKSIGFVTKIYKSTQNFPKEEVFGLTSQIRRCSISIPSNIAEGYGRNSDTELIRFMNIAMGSLFELQTQLEIAHSIGYLNLQIYTELYQDTRELEAIMVSFIKKLKTN